MSPDYNFYADAYLGQKIPESQFVPCMARARVALQRFDRIYQISGTAEERNLALCAMAEAIYDYRRKEGVVKATVGSVSVQYAANAHLQLWRELYEAASIYLQLYRGVTA